MKYCERYECKYYVGITMQPCVGVEDYILDGKCTFEKWKR